jgi:long-chain acyl-CoA synthetase
MIAEVTGEQATGSDDQLRLSEDLHLDSLGRVQLQSALEQRLGVEVEDDAIVAAKTLGELRAIVQADSFPPLGGTASYATEIAEATPRPPAVEEHSYPRWPWSWPVQAIRAAFIEFGMRPLVWLLAAPRVTRRTTKLPDGPFLIISNHVTEYDGALVLYALPGRLRRRVACAMSGEMLLDFRRSRNQQSVLRNLFAPMAYVLITALFNVFPLPRLRGFRKSFAHAGEAMDRGYSVLIFPEGTRSRDGKLAHFRPGIGLLALESNVPVLPVALLGLGEMREGKVGWFRSGRLQVRVGDIIADSPGTDSAELALRLEESVRRLQS